LKGVRPAAPRITPILYDAGALVDVDLCTVDTLARLALITRRRGRDLRLVRPAPELLSLLDLVGLADVLPCRDLRRGGEAVGRTGGRAGPCRGRT
jgi:hypothetical protein